MGYVSVQGGLNYSLNRNFGFFVNFSTTPRGDEGQHKVEVPICDGCSLGTRYTLPKEGYDGQLHLAPGLFYSEVGSNGFGRFLIERSSYLFHELFELFLRTDHEASYEDAHEAAKDVEGDQFGNKELRGVAPFFKLETRD